MKYPKPVMKMSELKKMGFPEDWLLRAYRKRGQSFSWKMSNAINAPIMFDTDGLEKYRKAQCGLGRGI